MDVLKLALQAEESEWNGRGNFESLDPYYSRDARWFAMTLLTRLRPAF